MVMFGWVQGRKQGDGRMRAEHFRTTDPVIGHGLRRFLRGRWHRADEETRAAQATS
jgi:hypothetical protein